MRRDRHTRLLQSTVEDRAQFFNRHGAIYFFAVHVQGRGGANPQPFSFAHRRFHRVFILRLDARLQLGNIDIVFLSLQHRDLIELGKLTISALFLPHLLLVGVNVIGESPIGIIVLSRQAVRIHSGVRCPGMNFDQGEIFIDEQHPVSICGNRV